MDLIHVGEGTQRDEAKEGKRKGRGHMVRGGRTYRHGYIRSVGAGRRRVQVSERKYYERLKTKAVVVAEGRRGG